MYYKDHRTKKGDRSTVFVYYAAFLTVAIVLISCGQVGVGNPVISADDALIFGGPDDSDDDDKETDPTSAAVTVTYNLNGGTGNLPVDSTAYSPGDTVTVQAPTNLYIDDVVDRDFVYWNTKADGTGDFYVPEDNDYETSFTVGSEDVTLYAIYIGNRGPAGGWICYDDQDSTDIPGYRFIETAYEDLTGTHQWHTNSGGFCSSIATSTDRGTGPTNTDAIIGDSGHLSSAAEECRSLGSEWFLPARDDLMGMWYLHQNGIGGFSGDEYWSSSNYNSCEAWTQEFYGVADRRAYNKDTYRRVRPCRYF